MRPRAACTASASRVVNALSSDTVVEVARNKQLYRQTFARGAADLEAGARSAPTQNRRGTTITFTPDAEIFGRGGEVQAGAALPAGALQGLSLRRRRDTLALRSRAALRRDAGRGGVPVSGRARRPSQGADRRRARPRPTRPSPAGTTFPNGQGSVEWAVAWPLWGDGNASYYCNTIPTPDGGTHEQGFRMALTRGLRAFAELVGAEEGEGHPGRGRRRPAPRSCSRSSSAIRSSRARPRTG